MKHTIRALLILILIVAVAGAVMAYTIARRGISANAQPSKIEAVMARTMRSLATPAAVKSRSNPVPPDRRRRGWRDGALR